MVAHDDNRIVAVRFVWLLVRLLIFTAIVTPASAASVTPGITLSSDNDTLYFGDTLVIEMEAVGVLEAVDISALFKDADLLRETTGTRIAVIEERVVEVKLRRMEFLPRRQGSMVFGPLSGESNAGKVTSNTLTFEVLPASTSQWQPDADDMSISVTLSNAGIGQHNSSQPYAAYIGQRIIADIVLRHHHPIADEQITLPDFEGFDVLPEYEQRRTVDMSQRVAKAVSVIDEPNMAGVQTTTIDESNSSMASSESSDERAGWRLISWRYHLFAQRSGDLRIGSVSWAGEAIRSRTQRARFTQQSQSLPVQIKPALHSVSWWLPASGVSLSESWSRDARTLTAGDEVIRTITLTARDVLASHLPEVEPLESRALSSTLIGQSRQQTLTGKHIQATASYTFRLVAQSPIPVFLDTVRVQWYDTGESRLREAIIPARRINVGLPDRADLLAEIALGTRWQDKLDMQLRSLASRFDYWHASLLILSLIAVALMMLLVQQTLQRRLNQQKGRGSNGLPSL